jgi:hypothetical protein
VVAFYINDEKNWEEIDKVIELIQIDHLPMEEEENHLKQVNEAFKRLEELGEDRIIKWLKG